MKYLTFILLSISLITACSSGNEDSTKTDITKFINTFIGSSGYGKTFPGAALPFSMLQISPDNGWSKSYAYEKEQLIGLSHLHLNGMPDVQLPNLLVMPTTKQVVKDTTGNGRNFMLGFLSTYLHANEQTSAGYYAINLTKEGIFAEVTLRERAALHSYQFSEEDTAKILLDLGWSHSGIDNTDSYMFIEDDSSTVVGYRSVAGDMPERRIYFAAQFSRKFTLANLVENGNLSFSDKEANSKYVCGAFHFTEHNSEPILLRVAFSSINEEAALANLAAEMDTWDFDAVKEEARQKWNTTLGKIEIKTNDIQVVTNFYSALYRSMLSPNLYSDTDGRFMNTLEETDQRSQAQYHNIHFAKSYNTTFPLLNLIAPKQTENLINSALVYQEGNMKETLPGFLHWGRDIAHQQHLFSAPAISAAWLKGIDSYNGLQVLNSYDSALFEKTATYALYNGKDFIAQEDNPQAVQSTLSNAYNEWSIAQLAKNFNDSLAYNFHIGRSMAFKKLFYNKLGLFAARDNGGTFLIEKDTTIKKLPIYAEQFKAVHSLDTLQALMGSANAFEAKLDSLFKPILNKNASNVLIELNKPENEFLFHAAYLYNYIKKPEKTQEVVRFLMDHFFKPTPDGLPVNDANGHISAWYVFSALGFLPVDPVGGHYEIGTPIVKQASLQLPSGKVLTIKVLNQSEENIYVQSVSFNNSKIDDPQLAYEQIAEGGELVFEMTSRKQLAQSK